MSMILRRLALAILIAASLATPFLAAHPVSALVIEAKLDDLVRESDTILTGKVTQVLNAQLDGTRAGVHTDVIIQPTNYLYGQMDGNAIAVRVEGGHKGEITVWVEDQPEFVTGEDVLLFLKLAATYEDVTPPSGIEQQNYYRTAGSFQGKWSCNNDTATDSKGQTYSLKEIEGTITAVHGEVSQQNTSTPASIENTSAAKQDFTWIYIGGVALVAAGVALALILRRRANA